MNNAHRNLSSNANHAHPCVVWRSAPLSCATFSIDSPLTMLVTKQESVIRNIGKHIFI